MMLDHCRDHLPKLLTIDIRLLRNQRTRNPAHFNIVEVLAVERDNHYALTTSKKGSLEGKTT
jgi:hypothetical protein